MIMLQKISEGGKECVFVDDSFDHKNVTYCIDEGDKGFGTFYLV